MKEIMQELSRIVEMSNKKEKVPVHISDSPESQHR